MRELERQKTPDTPSSSSDLIGRLAVVGAGRVGSSLAAAAAAAGVDVELAGREGAAEATRGAKAVLLCVPDAEIEAAVDAAAPAEPMLIGHTSGARGLEALGAAAARGAGTFCLHPLQTFPRPDTDPAGAPCAISGSSEDALAFARGLAERLGMRPFELDDELRAAYHAAAAIASNFLVTLEEAAVELLGRAGIEDGRELLAPLVLRTASNWAANGNEALTGPIARGDEATVERHLDALAELDPELLDSYRALAELTRRLAKTEVPA
jgi:predicted short-subunit dehydrogenase-like oxidoreductase (DUF2520 family)